MLSNKFRERLLSVIDCFENDFNMAFGELRFLIMFHEDELKKSEIDMIIDIFKNALSNARLKKNEKSWIKNNYMYFMGNSGANDLWEVKFSNKDFTYKELVDYVEQIKEIKEYDYLLRVPEVVLREEVKYINDIQVLKNTYINVLKDILNEKIR